MKKDGKLIILTLYILLSCNVYADNIVSYLFTQGKGQLKIIFNSKKLEKYEKDPKVSKELKQKIKLVKEVKKFGIREIGLKDNDNYTKLYDQKNKPLLYLVRACPKYSLEPFTWKFPIVGKFPYKGYFKKEDALKEVKRLKKLGYDVTIRNPSAWSTLGFFDDPIFTGMLNWDDGDLANVILHEMTHATIFKKNDLQFNENLAVFIGDNASLLFIEKKYGKNSKQYKEYKISLHDEKVFAEYMLKCAKDLKDLYNSFNYDMKENEKSTLKKTLIKKSMTNIKNQPFKNKKLYNSISNKTPNNAFFAGYVTYHQNLSKFEYEFKYKFNSNFKKYIKYLKKNK